MRSWGPFVAHFLRASTSKSPVRARTALHSCKTETCLLVHSRGLAAHASSSLGLVHLILTPQQALSALIEAIKINGGVMAVHQLRQVYRQHRGLKAVLDDSGGLKAFVEKHDRHLVWGKNKISLAKPAELGAAEHLESDAAGVEQDQMSLGAVSTSLRVLVAESGGSLPLSELDVQLAGYPSVREALSAAGGLEACMEEESCGLVLHDGRVSLAGNFLAALLTQKGGSMTDAEFVDLCQQHKHLPGVVKYMETAVSMQEKEVLRAMYASWREDRLVADASEHPVQPAACSLDWWYGEACLLCLQHCPLDDYAQHAQSASHLEAHSRSIESSELMAPRRDPREEVPRPEDSSSWTSFAEALGVHGQSVLVLGEGDFAWPLRLAELQQRSANRKAQLAATSPLMPHDAQEASVYLHHNVPAWFPRRSLRSMDASLAVNLGKLEAHGALIAYGVDARRLLQTAPQDLQERLPVDSLFFAFPQASPCSSPYNAALILDLFKTASDRQVLSGGGALILVLLASQFLAWDVACIAAGQKFELSRCCFLPKDLCQARSLAGTIWQASSTCLYEFRRKDTFRPSSE